MLLSQNWVTALLRAQNPDWSVTAEEMDAGYVRVGFETEGYTPIEETTGPLVLGVVENIEELTGFKKPIRYCKVNVGDANGTGELQGIVCGARNFKEGDTVVVSLPGAELPGGFKIAARETYDHVSEGMICSAAELGLASKQTKGIITLPATAGAPGTDARAVLGLDDTIFDVNVTPDRGYALSARGLTRELASAFNLTYTDPAQDPAIAGVTVDVPPVSGTTLDVSVAPETKTVRFGLRKVTGVDPTAKTPFWIERELLLSGQRLVNLPTDITNFVMILLGQPMHAFDANRIDGSLQVRTAQAGEKLTTLDHVERTLSAEDVVICDNSGVQSLAGVMGGSTSEIADDTTDVYFEAAIWDPILVARTCRRHKLSSEASRRFERGVDPTLVEVALDVAASLLAQYGGGTIEAGRTLIGDVPAPATITMPVDFPGRIAGVTYSRETVVKRLEEVGCTVSVSECGGKLDVTAPAWRSDLTFKEALVEEVLRLEGLEDIPSVVPTPPPGRGLTPAQLRRRAIGHALAYNGYLEILPTPFIANDVFDVWGLEQDDPRRATVSVQNPLESDHAILGTTLLPSMLESLRRNIVRGQHNVALYGVEQVSFARGEGKSPMPSVSERPSEETIAELVASLPHQPLHVAVVGCGEIEPEGPWGAGRAFTYADAIEAARLVARAADVELEVENAEMLPWHPGRCAALKVYGEVVGYAGELHPQVLERAELPARTCAMELDVTALPFAPSFPAPTLSAFPALLQDVALVVSEDTPAEAVRKTVVEGAGPLVEKVELFDVYRSETLGADKKSLAFNIVFRAADRTLTDDECSEARMAAVELAAQKHGAELRA
ncbi:phenylalanine--tRNA ligase subunit beta [Corynebacterium epidermidicanis]|uniref:Phenylalanine--tRNA ligase beta subunit n=1 Tax=Corynebacterium epidermidicanis TaxID=1050174 RepID=A0A0G3GVX5_9CORY|nr:phenylalanine--tRNA ligase subunit beta [Corynebacterium epidermidicanis]AKK03027.1 phenylalanyl-tRNA synthetase beta subunit [Corynebacterium epidermidicanis]